MNIFSSEFLNYFFFAVLSTALSAIATWFVTSKNLPASHRIAVIGFPGAGKTTLITAVFAHLFRRGVYGATIIPRGEETIARVNANMEALELNRQIGPTRDQDVFAYRADVSVAAFLRPRRYKLEIGDFPGEDSVAFAEEQGPWLHRTNYFQWAIEADAFLFIVDANLVRKDRSGEYVARQKSAFRAVWHRLQEHHLDGSNDLRRKAVVLVFTKTDLLPEAQSIDFYPSPRVAAQIVASVTEPLSERFRDLVAYFERESNNFSVVATSVRMNIDGDPLGVPEVARSVMPGRQHAGSRFARSLVPDRG